MRIALIAPPARKRFGLKSQITRHVHIDFWRRGTSVKNYDHLSTGENNAFPSQMQLHIRMLDMACVVLLTFMMARCLRAQSDTGAISGTVTDASGAVVQGAAVTATNTANGLKLSAVTGNTGGFNILAVPRGDYTVATSAKGFEPQSVVVTVTVTETQDVAF
jgi:hypothetical protein